MYASAESDSAPSIALVPPFSPSVHDYYVRCAAGTNALAVSMKASPGAQTSLRNPVTAAPSPEQSLELSVNENQAIVAVASLGEATADYWVRCLPHDFPAIQMTAHAENGTPSPGYYVVGAKATSKNAAYAMVVDVRGVPVWYARDRVPFPPSDLLDVDHVVDGGMTFIPSAASPFETHEMRPVQTTYVSPTGATLNNHELRKLANGNFLALADGVVTGVDLTGLHLSFPDGGIEDLGPDSNIQTCDVVEFEPSGKVVWTWVGLDHLDPAQDSIYPQSSPVRVTAPDGGTVVDPFHCNSIDVDPKNGNLLVSSRHMDSVFYIERSTGTILWKMGGKDFTKDNATYVSVANAFHRQHDARLQPGWSANCSGGAGQISMFDNETAEPGPARAIVYDVNVGSADGDGGSTGCDGGTGGVAKIAWQYKGAHPSAAMGSFRIQANGARVIAWGAYAPSDSRLHGDRR